MGEFRIAWAIAVAFHDDLVSVVRESVEGALSEDGVVEERDPLVDGAVGGDEGRGPAVTLDDDLVEVAGLLSVEAAEAEVVDDEQVGSEQAAHDALGGVIGSGLVDELEERIATEEEDATSGAAGAVAEGASEERLSDADGSEEEDVFVAFEEGEAEEISDAVAIERDGASQSKSSNVWASSNPARSRRVVRFLFSLRSISSWRASSRKSRGGREALRA